MKKLIIYSLLASLLYGESSIKEEMKILPFNRDSLSLDQGGLNYPMKAYSDGIGLVVVNGKGESGFNNSIQNNFIYKYGVEADLRGESLRQYIALHTKNKTDIEQSKELGKLALSTGWNDYQECNDKNEFTYNDRFLNRECNGTFPKSCKEIKFLNSNLQNGEYIIDPDEEGKVKPFKVYCDLDNGGWTKIEYKKNIDLQNFWTNGNKRRYLDKNFETELTEEQINAIRLVSTQGKQNIQIKCKNASMFYNKKEQNYSKAIGIKFQDNTELNYNLFTKNILKNIKDECSDNNKEEKEAIFELNSISVPVKNISTVDNGKANKKFGVELINNPAWLK